MIFHINEIKIHFIIHRDRRIQETRNLVDGVVDELRREVTNLNQANQRLQGQVERQAQRISRLTTENRQLRQAKRQQKQTSGRHGEKIRRSGLTIRRHEQMIVQLQTDNRQQQQIYQLHIYQQQEQINQLANSIAITQNFQAVQNQITQMPEMDLRKVSDVLENVLKVCPNCNAIPDVLQIARYCKECRYVK